MAGFTTSVVLAPDRSSIPPLKFQVYTLHNLNRIQLRSLLFIFSILNALYCGWARSDRVFTNCFVNFAHGSLWGENYIALTMRIFYSMDSSRIINIGSLKSRTSAT